MLKPKGHFDLNSLLAGILVVFVSLVVARLATQERPEKTHTLFEAFVHAEEALRRSGMP